MEVWKPFCIQGRIYYVSNTGRVKNKYNKILHTVVGSSGYEEICLCVNYKRYYKRVHRLVAQAFLPNPNNYPTVMHKDNNKANPEVSNLEWGTNSKNTKDAYKDGLAKNDKSWDDNQSIHICSFDLQGNLLKMYGSVGEASRELHITKTTILNQCNHNVKTKPRCGYWFRYLTEYETNGFVL